MKKSQKGLKRKRFTLSSIVALVIGFGLIGIGSYQAFLYGNPGAYFVIFLGIVLNAIIFLFYRG